MSGDARYWLREHRGTLAAFAAFLAMFAVYAANHPAGLNANVATTAANKGVLLAMVAMAQTLVVLTSGIDLSVGMVMVLANCLASHIVVGEPGSAALGVLGVLVVGAEITEHALVSSALNLGNDTPNGASPALAT